MASISSFFSTYSIYSRKDKVKIADGSYSSIAGKESIPITPTLPLSVVLHVSNFTLNLLFVNNLTKFLNCYVTFFPTRFVFQDLKTRMMIGRKHDDGLYVLDDTSYCFFFSTVFSSPNKG